MIAHNKNLKQQNTLPCLGHISTHLFCSPISSACTNTISFPPLTHAFPPLYSTITHTYCVSHQNSFYFALFLPPSHTFFSLHFLDPVFPSENEQLMPSRFSPLFSRSLSFSWRTSAADTNVIFMTSLSPNLKNQCYRSNTAVVVVVTFVCSL
jgi:hypothetical protein